MATLPAYALARHIAWRDGLTAQIETQQEVMKQQLLESAPVELRSWLDKELIVQDLTKNGRVAAAYEFNDLESIGFDGLQEFRAALRRLRDAWANCVRIAWETNTNGGFIEVDACAIVESPERNGRAL